MGCSATLQLRKDNQNGLPKISPCKQLIVMEQSIYNQLGRGCCRGTFSPPFIKGKKDRFKNMGVLEGNPKLAPLLN